MSPYTPLFIDGQQTKSNSTFDVVSPSSGLVVGQCANASREDCQGAVDAAAKAFGTWEHSSVAERQVVFIKAAELVATDKYINLIKETIQAETAASEAWCSFNWNVASNILQTTAGLVSILKGEILPSAVPGGKLEIHRRAIGVVLSMAPWNAPIALSLRAVAIPLICGNTVVLKSSEYSPRSQAVVVELLHEAGLPAGVLNYISVSREDAPARTAELIAHPAVRSINFTGSDRVGRIIAVEAAKHLKPCVLELGGKAPVIVLNDADVSAASRTIVNGAFFHSGQICMSSERLIVQSEIAPRLIDAVREVAKGLQGNIGPLFTEGSAENVVNMVKEAVDLGAELLLGDLTRQRAVVQPHLVKLEYKGGATGKGVRLWEKESFGPVDEAVELANASEFSLTSALWTNDGYTAQEVATRMRAGFVNINGSTVHSEPFANARGLGGSSGYGRFDIDSFTNLRAVVTYPRPQAT